MIPCLFLIALTAAWLVIGAGARAGTVGETHRTAHTPSAALRDAQHRDTLHVTVWYPAADGPAEAPLQIGPPGKALFDAGSAAAEAPFGSGRHPVTCSHGVLAQRADDGVAGSTALARAGSGDRGVPPRHQWPP